MDYFIRDKKGHCGDNVCCISAAIEFSEKTGGTVYVNFFKDLVEEYNHPGLKFGMKGVELHTNASLKHRNKTPGLFKNILGTYYAELGLPIDDPKLRLPMFEPCERRVLIQPFSRFAVNPSVELIQSIVDRFILLTGIRPYVIGSEDTNRIIENVDYSLLKDSVPFLMRQVQNAICVLTPRSFSANLAAGYGVPAFMWSPCDGEDWHLDYSTWKGVKCNFNMFSDKDIDRDNVLMYLRRFVLEFGFNNSDIRL